METVRIQFKYIDFDVKGNYEKGEEEVRYYDDLSGHPGSASSFEIEEICVFDSSVDVFELFSSADLEIIIELVITEIEE